MKPLLLNPLPLPALSDNYIWLLHDGQHAVVVDPGDAQPVQAALQTHHLQLQAILLTHHHADHVGGVAQLRSTTGATVYGPAYEILPEPVVRVDQDTTLSLLGLRWQVLQVPGHTSGHIAWYCPDTLGHPALFSGDTLFSGGCGRLFEGTAQQMYQSLQTLAALPPDTRVFCAHEYTVANLRFAEAVEPDNIVLQHYRAWCETQRQQNQSTLPSTLEQELAINPFLRCHIPAVIEAARNFFPLLDSQTPSSVFAALREWKNVF